MAAETTDLSVEILKRLQADMAQLRRDVGHIQESQIDIVRIISRLDNRISDVKQDLESMMKMEIVGAPTHHTTRMEQMLGDGVNLILARLDKLEAK